MNIFILDENPEACARYHCDTHVVSQLKEGAQIMSTACHLLGVWRDDLNRPTHVSHRCVKWAAASLQNAEWLLALCFALNSEYRLRRKAKGKAVVDHKSFDVAASAWSRLAKADFANAKMTPWALAMPTKYQTSDAVQSYRNYYIGEKSQMKNSQGKLVDAVWTERGPPPWWPSAQSLCSIFEEEIL